MSERQAGLVVLRITGRGALEAFRDEAGGHRWQRIPPTEKRGRVQTSTITVAVLPEPTAAEVRIDPRELKIAFCRGSGAGGQKRNKTETAVQVTHLPTGLMVRCETERSQHQNKATALAVLGARLLDKARSVKESSLSAERKQQVGSGMRGDKRRTVRCQEGQVHDHVTGRVIALAAYERGEW
ncbi:MAG: peptide chain release factor-like protein [Byssovorax sp.]